MNQTDMIQSILAAERQASALTEDAKAQRDNSEATIQQEIDALRARYEQQGSEYLQQLEAKEQAKQEKALQEMDARLTRKLSQVESIYASQKDAWIEAIFQRIVGKAGD